MDSHNAFLDIQPEPRHRGTDWRPCCCAVSEMADAHGIKTEIIDQSDGEVPESKVRPSI